MEIITWSLIKAELARLYTEQLGRVAVNVLKARTSADLLETANNLKLLARGLEDEAERQRVRTLAYAAGGFWDECEFHFRDFRPYCARCVKAQDVDPMLGAVV